MTLPVKKTPFLNTFQRPFQQGFTLLELLITLSIVAILTFITAPNFGQLGANSEAKAVIQTLSGLVRTAKNYAIHHQASVILCPSHDGRQCSQDWQDGALIFQDNNQDKQANLDEPIIRFQTAFADKGTLSWHALRQYLLFSGQGVARSAAGSFIYCPRDKNPKYAHALIISFSGKARWAQDANKDGIRESGNTKNIACT